MSFLLFLFLFILFILEFFFSFYQFFLSWRLCVAYYSIMVMVVCLCVSPLSLVSAVPSPVELLCTGFRSWCVTSSPVRATAAAEEEEDEEAATVAADEELGACLETPPVAPPTPPWLLPVVCLEGLRWLPAAGLLE